MSVELDVNLEKRTAYLEVPYFTATIPDKQEMGETIKHLSQIEGICLKVVGDKVGVSIKYDFGIHVPDKIWEMRDNSFIHGFNDKGLNGEWEMICKEAVLEYVRKILPTVLDSIQRSAEQLKSEIS